MLNYNNKQTPLPVPVVVRANKEGYDYLARLYQGVSMWGNSTLYIDFGKCKRFDANLAAALGAIVDVHKATKNDVIALGLSSSLRKTLARNGFLKTLDRQATEKEKENYVRYTKFSKSALDDFKVFVDEWIIQKSKFPKHTALAGDKISETLYELYVNAITHGDTEFVYICGEYMEEDSKLSITIVDKGRTIPKNVNDFLYKGQRSSLSSCKAIEWAFVSGHTTKDTPGGLGLALLQEFITQNKGSMQMVSADGLLEFKEGIVSTLSLTESFPGTIVNLNFNFDDHKNYYMMSERVNLFDLL